MSVIDLSKKAKISLEKNGLFNEKMNVVLALDISGSMDALFRNKTVQKTVERILGLGMNLDSNGAIEVYLFGRRAHYAGEANVQNINGFVKNQITSKYPLESNTYYAEVMKKIAAGETDSAPTGKPKGLFSFFKKGDGIEQEKNTTSQDDSLPTVVFFITDGEASDEYETKEFLKKIAPKPIFWQYIGIGNSRFSLLSSLDTLSGRVIDNANFFSIPDIGAISDEKLYDKILVELPSWLTEARQKRIVK